MIISKNSPTSPCKLPRIEGSKDEELSDLVNKDEKSQQIIKSTRAKTQEQDRQRKEQGIPRQKRSQYKPMDQDD